LSFVRNLREGSPRDGLSVVQDFVKAAAGVATMAELRELLDDVVQELGFDFYALTHHVRFGHPSVGHVRLSNYPLEWLAMIREDETHVDPVLRAAERTSSGFMWDELDRMVTLSARDRLRFEQAGRHSTQPRAW
jgi:LuxR family quorum-sensing system transcriptional regulator CciR